MDIENRILFSIESLKDGADEAINPQLEVSEFIKSVPKKMAVWYGLIMANYTEDDDIKVQLETLQFPPELKQFVENVLASKPFDEKYILCKPQTGLEFLKHVFNFPNESYKSGNNVFLSLLTSILIINTLLLADNAHWQDKSILRSSKLIRSKNYEIDDRVPIYAAVFRMFCLLHFLEQNQSNQWLCLKDALVEDLGTKNLKDYFKGILEILNQLTLGPKRKFSILKIKDGDTTISNLIEPLSIGLDDLIELSKNEDYTYFKSHPFVKLDSNQFGVINNIFVANQLYLSIKFRMLEICKRTNIIKNFFSLFNIDFVEKYLFNEVLNHTFGGDKNMLVLNEDECKIRINEYNMTNNPKIKTEGLPDAYVRCNNKILIIECKGKIISSKAIENEKEFVKDVETDIIGEKKGTGQLSSYWDIFINGGNKWDKGLPYNYVIYPLIVVDDSKLCVDGLNRHAINCTNGNIHENISRIKPVTILDMDTLILISDLVKKGELDIFEQIEQYHNYIDGKHGTYSQTEKLYYSDISFSSYIMDKFEMRSPSIINDWFEELV